MDGRTGILSCIRTGRVPGGLGRIHWIDGTGQKLSCIHRRMEPVFPVFTKGWTVEPVSPVSTEGWTAGPVLHPLSTDGWTVEPVFTIFTEG